MRLTLRFVRGSGWDSKIIEWGSRSWTSHVELIDGSMTFGAQLSGGVRWRYTEDLCYRNVTRSEVWGIEITNQLWNISRDIIRDTTGLPYDWRAILAFSFGERDWREPDSWFCSEWAAMMLEKLGLVRIPKVLPFDRITPRDVYLMFTGLPGARLVQQQTGKIVVVNRE